MSRVGCRARSNRCRAPAHLGTSINVPVIVIEVLAVFGPMLVEAWLAAVNERHQRNRGGIEPSGDVYRIMRWAYPAAFLGMIAEGALRSLPPPPWIVAGMGLFALSKALKWWAIRSLGSSWTFRVIVVPGSQRVASGPYRYLRHPNYAAVLGELIAVSVMTRAIVAGPIALAGFGALMLARIRTEDAALDAILGRH